MSGSEPDQTPSEPFTTERLGRTYYNYNQLDPQRVENILRMAENRGRVDMLYKLYDDMEVTDTRYSGIANQVRATIAQMPLRIQPVETSTQVDEKIAQEYRDYAEVVLNNLDTHLLAQSFVDPYFYGAKLYSVDWELRELMFGRSMYFPSEVEEVRGRHLVQSINQVDDNYGQLKVRTDENPAGQPIDELPDENHVFLEMEKGKHNYAKLGVARKILPWYLSLRFVKDWWVQYVENYGSPIRVAKYPRATKRSTRKKVQKFLKQLGNNQYGLFPQGMEVEFKDLNRQGKVNVHREFIREAHKEYSIHILGQAGTMGESREGSYAESVVLNGIRMDIITNISKVVAKGFRKLIREGLKLNYGDNFEDYFVPEVEPILLNSQNAQKRAQAARIASESGVPVPTSYFYNQVLGIEKPQEGEQAVQSGVLSDLGDDLPIEGERLSEQSGGSQGQSGEETGDTSVVQDADQENGQSEDQ